ncbi:MAG TPA: YbaB/EbfC family nucleoid-associated protein [Candidatus Avisuccinivibrio pullicola]|nr:YbaB/EbfC family nucleoid-associated protein [Candidatus Avisuccinivibrio pullicola]
MFNMNNMMKQAQKMQERMEALREEIDRTEVTGEAGAGLVKVVVTGGHEVRRVTIDDSIYNDDKEMVEDLIAAAFNDAQRRVDEMSREKMSELTKGLHLPPGVKLPF